MVYRLNGLREEEAREWLVVSKACRNARNFPTASDAVLHADRLGAKASLIHHARLLYLEGQVRGARPCRPSSCCAMAARLKASFCPLAGARFACWTVSLSPPPTPD